MMHDREKSDSSIVATKPANDGGKPPKERVERRGEAEGNAFEPSMPRTLSRNGVTAGLERVRQIAVKYPRWEPSAGMLHARICAGGA